MLDTDDVVHAGVAQVVEVRGVGAESVLDDDDGQVGMLLAKAFQLVGNLVKAGVQSLEKRIGGEVLASLPG